MSGQPPLRDRTRGWLLALAFIAITAPLTWLWINGGQEAYMAFFKQTARPIFKLIGVTGYKPSSVNARFLNIVPFVALMLITPGLEWSKRIGGILLGYPIIFLCQVGLVFAVFKVAQPRGYSPEAMTDLFPFYMFYDAVPLLLWAFFAHEFLGGLMRRILPPAPDPPAPDPPTPDAPAPDRDA